MNNKRPIPLSATSGPALKTDGHLADAWLLFAIDGELSASEYAVVKEHVRACWTCRARQEQLQQTIQEIVEYEQAIVAQDMPPSPDGRKLFMARLSELADTMGQPSLIRHWIVVLSKTFRSGTLSTVAWIAVACVVLFFGGYVIFSRNVPPVSASELLQWASESEAAVPSSPAQPVVVQRLMMKVNGKTFTRTLYRDRVRNRLASRTDVSRMEEDAALHAFQKASFNWDDPLSPRAYSQWRDGTAKKTDVVTKLGGGLIRVDTTASSGPVAEASLTMRSSDYHPVKEKFRLADDSQVEIAELSYEVFSFTSLDPDVFGITSQATSLRLPARTPVRQDADEVEEAMTELEVRSALHAIGADLGEQIEIQPEANGSVLVKGIAEDDARKRELVAALDVLPHTTLAIETVEQVAAHQNNGNSVPVRATMIDGSTSLLQASLKERFPDNDARTSYINETLALAQGASARAWALNRLAGRYNAEQLALLTPAARQRLGALVEDHLSALREEIGRLQSQLGEVLSISSNTPSANVASTARTTGATTEKIDDWRTQIHRVHSSTETATESVAVLLTGSSTDQADNPEAIEVGLRTTLTQLRAELQDLDEQVHKQF